MNKKFYITTALPYVNAEPHIGFALELIQADVLARYHRLLDEDTFFLTGTDEHGQKIEKAAKEAKTPPEEFTNKISEKFKELTKVLDISNDDFIRTTDKKKHWPTVENIWKELEKNGDIYKKKYKGLYCVGCEAFIKEKDLIDGKCPNHQKEPELIEEENYFFKLSKYSERVKNAIESNEINIVPARRKSEIINFIKEGIEDISISRSKENLGWGIPVPGDKDQVIYVWFEALLNYLYPKGRWPADVHCIGKDIFRFHALLWPAILFALNFPPPKNILVHGFITVDGQKMSKSLGNIIDPFELVEKYGVDSVRYFFLREIPSTEDGDFTYEKFEERYNADLAKGLGNLVARILKLSEGVEFSNEKQDFVDQVREKYTKAFDGFKFNEVLILIWELISYCDKLIEEEKPWEKGKEKIIGDLLFLIDQVAKLLQPFLPETSEKILKQLKTKKTESLFPRI